MISNTSITPIKNMLKSALNIHNFSFKNHTSTAIIGTNGAGKSTLINTILGIREDYNVKAQNNNIPYHNNKQYYSTTQTIGGRIQFVQLSTWAKRKRLIQILSVFL
ncbi:ABC transporter. ATP-binding protein [Helicobacter pylori F32]|nr:ATP-binding cassette domain-containing protein [Helicobacter pylori]BAJ58169.1 ABC transporter. ATP-binding protein [Helicobacter pylori F32]